MLRLLQMAFLGVYISKIFRGGMPPDPPSRSQAFGARLHDHSHDAGFATDPVTSCNWSRSTDTVFCFGFHFSVFCVHMFASINVSFYIGILYL
jgi:hypothetical protein